MAVPSPVDRADARRAGLRYVRDDQPGIRRQRNGTGFVYVGPEGERVADGDALTRIRKLAIPPAWTDVWVCAREDGHIQATGRDARGRKQYRYHAEWRRVRDEAKFDRMAAFARALPRIRRRVEADLRRPGLPREKVLAAVVRLLEATLIRVGNEEYARANKSYGLTTLRDPHAEIDGDEIRLEFMGKAGKRHLVTLRDRRLAGIVQRCQDLPGQELFQYVAEDGTQETLDSADVNAYLQAITGDAFTAKDFRTWAGTVLAAIELGERGVPASETEAKRQVAEAIRRVAERLSNTPAVARKCYVHPGVIEAYRSGQLPALFGGAVASAPEETPHGLGAVEHAAAAIVGAHPSDAPAVVAKDESACA